MSKHWIKKRVDEMQEAIDNSTNTFTYPNRDEYECRGIEHLADRLFVFLDHPENYKFSYKKTVDWLDQALDDLMAGDSNFGR